MKRVVKLQHPSSVGLGNAKVVERKRKVKTVGEGIKKKLAEVPREVGETRPVHHAPPFLFLDKKKCLVQRPFTHVASLAKLEQWLVKLRLAVEKHLTLIELTQRRLSLSRGSLPVQQRNHDVPLFNCVIVQR